MSRPKKTVFRAASVFPWVSGFLFVAMAASGCTTTVTTPDVPTEDPYESCEPGDDCTGGTACAETTLPASDGYSGYFCTNNCSDATDCQGTPSGYDAECVNGQCYLTCPTGSGSCPYSQGCFTFSDQNGNPIDLCTP